MALNFYTQGIDFSGFGEGIAQGIRIAAERKLQQDKLFDSEWKEYSRMFDPEKISDSDRKLYIDAYEKTHQTAKALDRAERRGSTDEINNLSLQLKQYQGEMASVYGKSRMKNEKALRMTKTIDTAEKNGYIVPVEYKENRNRIVKTPISDLTDDDLESDFELNLTPSVKDMSSTMKLVNEAKTNPVRQGESAVTIDLPRGIKASISRYTPGFVASPESISMISSSLQSQNVNNYGVDAYKGLVAKLKMPDGSKEKEDALSVANNLVKKAGLSSIDEIKPIHFTSASIGLYDPKSTGKEVIDMTDFNTKVKQLGLLNNEEKNQISAGFLEVARQNASSNKKMAAQLTIYSFLMRDGADAVVSNAPQLREAMTELDIKDPTKMMNDIKAATKKGFSLMEAFDISRRNQEAASNN
jgi:hypothetical protein